MKKNVIIYNGPGTSPFNVECLIQFFKDHTVHLVNFEDVIQGTIFDHADIFVIPGGADTPYVEKLTGQGNKHIRVFVENGGTYVGICAGAYYGCRSLAWHINRKDEISGPRELAFSGATAYGSLPDIAPYYDATWETARITPLICDQNETTIHALYHGGPAFDFPPSSTDTIVHARYKNILGFPPAIIEEHVKKGRAILVGVHLEITSTALAAYPTNNKQEFIDRLRNDLEQYSNQNLQFLEKIIWN